MSTNINKLDVLAIMDAAAIWRGEFMHDFTSAAELKAARDAVSDLIDAVTMIITCPHIDLDDLCYVVRERELEGWDGPAVKQWSDGVKKLNAAMEAIKGNRHE